MDRSPIQLQRLRFVITNNLLLQYLCRLFAIGVRQPLKPKLYDNHGHSGRLTQGSAKIPQAGRASLISSEFRLRNDIRVAFICLVYELFINIQHA